MEQRQERRNRRFSIMDLVFGIGFGLIFFAVLYGLMSLVTGQIESSGDYQSLVEQMQDAGVTWGSSDVTVTLMLLFVGGLDVTMPGAVREAIINQALGASSAGDVLSIFGIDLNQVLSPLTFDATYGSLLLSVFGIVFVFILFLMMRIKANRLGWTVRSVSFLVTVWIGWFFLVQRSESISFLSFQGGVLTQGLLALGIVIGLSYLALYPQGLSGLSAAARGSLLVLVFASCLQLYLVVTDETKYNGDSMLRTVLTVASLDAGSGGMYDLLHGGRISYKANVLGADVDVPVTMLNGETSTGKLNQSIEDVLAEVDTDRVTEQLLTILGGERPDLSDTQLNLEPVDYGIARQTIQALDAESAGSVPEPIDSESAYWILILIPFVLYLLVSIRAFRTILDPIVFAVLIGVTSFLVAQATTANFTVAWRNEALLQFAQQPVGLTPLYAAGMALLAGLIGFVIKRKPTS